MSFRNRAEAAELLAAGLTAYRGRSPLVLAIPRGAVPMGKIISDALGGELDVVLARKLRAPRNPELAIGSIDDAGAVYLNHALRHLWTESYLEAEQQAQLQALRQRRARYGVVRSPLAAAGRIAIVVDDWVATGSTIIAALRAVRAARPATLIAATGVACMDALRLIGREADEVVCLDIPFDLYAIGTYYRDVGQASDDDVAAILNESARVLPATA